MFSLPPSPDHVILDCKAGCGLTLPSLLRLSGKDSRGVAEKVNWGTMKEECRFKYIIIIYLYSYS